MCPRPEYGTAITLESAYDDWCAWTLAKATGNEEMAARFERTMYNYRNVFDPETGFMRGRGARFSHDSELAMPHFYSVTNQNAISSASVSFFEPPHAQAHSTSRVRE